MAERPRFELRRAAFDAALMGPKTDFRHEVIVHELLHMKVLNHGKVFRSLLRTYLGRTTLTTLDKPRKAKVG